VTAYHASGRPTCSSPSRSTSCGSSNTRGCRSGPWRPCRRSACCWPRSFCLILAAAGRHYWAHRPPDRRGPRARCGLPLSLPGPRPRGGRSQFCSLCGWNCERGCRADRGSGLDRLLRHRPG